VYDAQNYSKVYKDKKKKEKMKGWTFMGHLPYTQHYREFFSDHYPGPKLILPLHLLQA